MPELFGRPLYAYLPMGGYIYELQRPVNERSEWKVLFHMIYTVIGGTAIVSSCLVSLIFFDKTGTLNPLEQNRIINEQIAKEKQKKERKEFINKKIFGPGGYADTNFDKKIDLYEKASAYKKLGLEDFPKEDLTSEQLEQLIKIYEEK